MKPKPKKTACSPPLTEGLHYFLIHSSPDNKMRQIQAAAFSNAIAHTPSLDLEVWSFPGAWMLELGVSHFPHHVTRTTHLLPTSPQLPQRLPHLPKIRQILRRRRLFAVLNHSALINHERRP